MVELCKSRKKKGPRLQVTLPETKPEKWWLGDDPFLLGRPIFRGELFVVGKVLFPKNRTKSTNLKEHEP